MITTKEDYKPIPPNWYYTQSYPSGYFTYIIPGWEDLGNDLYNDKYYGLPLIKQWGVQAILDSLIPGIRSDIEKMAAIYKHIQQNVKWNGVYSNVVFILNCGSKKHCILVNTVCSLQFSIVILLSLIRDTKFENMSLCKLYVKQI